MIGESTPDMIGVVFRLAEESSQVLIVDRVVDHVPLAPRSDQPAITQETELVRHPRF